MDVERQQDELVALESIYDCKYFTTTHDQSQPEGMFHAHVDLPDDFHIQIKNTDQPECRERINYLPPITLHFTLPQTYPSEEAPWFILFCSWLTRVQLSKLAAQLDAIWNENRNEVLFMWFEFLKSDALNTLNIHDTCDLTTLARLRPVKDPSDEKMLMSVSNKVSSSCGSQVRKPMKDRGNGSTDQRVFVDLNCGALLLATLIEFNQHQISSEFNGSFHDCGVCFQQKYGYQSIKFERCNHVYCKQCMAEYFKVKINDGTVKSLQCPTDKCSSEALPSQIRELVDKEIFSKYDKLLLNSSLDTMKDIVYCPRTFCQCPVIAESDSNLASCSACCYAFCTYCKRAYHGVEPCTYKHSEIAKIKETYLHGSEAEKLELEKRHGKRNIQKLIEEALSSEYIDTNSKECPQCRCHIEKTDGCNKMVCWHCNCNFCWLCNKMLDSNRPYLHYNNQAAPCYQQLFHGTVIDQQDEFEEFQDMGIFIN